MHKLLFIISIFFIIQTTHAQNFGGNQPSTKWQQINTKAARVIFPKGLDSQANRIQNIIQTLSTIKTIGNQQRRWNIILQNQTTIPNAYVRMAPIMSELYLTPPQDNFSTGSLRWDDNLIIHEYRHIQQFSNFNNGLTKAFSFLLGEEGQLLANAISIPDYFFEGDAVWQETLVSNQGRGRMPAFYNGFKSLWQANKNYSWMKLRSGSYKSYVPDHYELGYILVAYGYQTYGADFWKNVTTDAVKFKGLFYSFNNAIKKYSGKTYAQFREDAMNYFKSRSFSENKNTETLNYITATEKNNVVDYLFPNYISDDSVIVTKRSYKQISAFYLLTGGKEKKICVKDVVVDDYFSCNSSKIVYAVYQQDLRWTNKDYSVIEIADIKTGKQKQLTPNSKYFSPDINKAGTEIIAVQTHTDGSSNLTRLDATNGNVILQLPNKNNYFFTQTRYIDANTAVSAVRDPEGRMALVKIDLTNGNTQTLTPFTFNVLGYPFVKGQLIYFNAMNNNADKVFVLDLKTNIISAVTNNSNGIYHPVVNSKNEMLVSAFTAEGSRLAKITIDEKTFLPLAENDLFTTKDLYTPDALKTNGAGILYQIKNEKYTAIKYRRSFQLFNFHSARPVVNDPEYGYTLYGDNVLSSFSNTLTYTYNRNELSHNIEYAAAYAGWFPVVRLGVQGGFNRTFDTAVGKSFSFNSAKLNLTTYLPLIFTKGVTNKSLNIGVGYNAEQLYYTGIGKNIFTNKAFEYANAFLYFNNISRQAKQQVNPRWAQALSATYRHAFTFIDSRKLVAAANFYFPGIFPTHSLLLQAAFQKRDTLSDIFSNTFSYSRGYLGLSTRQMYKLAANYQLPVAYPDWGVGNIVFFQRIRANLFYDYTNARARLNTGLTDIINRSTGAEIFFDTKVWNALPVSFGIRYARFLDADLRNPGAVNRWEFILPIDLIPK